MCIIIGEVENISKTKILAVKLENNKQFILYSNKVDTKQPVAMILPFPNKNVKPQIIKTNKVDNDIFEDLDECFYSNLNDSFSLDDDIFLSVRTNSLQVFRSGNYRYSIANSVQDLNKVDTNVFQLNGSVISLLSQYEENGFGFIVCIIDKDVEYTPFAYISSLYKNKLFIPTKHYHEKNRIHTNYEWADDWDHNIYIILEKNHKVLNNNFKVADKPFDFNNKYSLAKCFGISPIYSGYTIQFPKEQIYKLQKKGIHHNIDIIV